MNLENNSSVHLQFLPSLAPTNLNLKLFKIFSTDSMPKFKDIYWRPFIHSSNVGLKGMENWPTTCNTNSQ